MKRLLCAREELDTEKTFECGQCFRWNREGDSYLGVVRGRLAQLTEKSSGVYITSNASEELWREYFDLDTDYAAVTASFKGEYLERCAKFGRGIRILRQEPWEALCSFIISQCNNIARIKGIVERLCEKFGEPFDIGGRVFFAFPTPERLAALETEALDCIRAGYRAEYIISAAQAVSDGSLDLETLRSADFIAAKKQLRTVRGVGEKVANCALLYGLGHTEGFPVDVWMKRVLKEHFPSDFDPASLGKYAGLAQQYMFYYARSGGK